MTHKKPSLTDIHMPLVMGILNATPDSFSDGGRYLDPARALDRIHLMIRDGAQIIDVGGESTRPGSEPVSEQEELDRVIPILERAVKTFSSVHFSIDTTKYTVAKEALDLGVQIVNDVSGMQKEPRLADLCAEYDAHYVIMHSQGDPKTMQDDPRYSDVVNDIYRFFSEKIREARARGAKKLILDPGIGFGKTQEHNLRLLADLDKFLDLNFPILVGASRKSMIGKILGGRPVEERVAGTLAVHYHSMMKGARIFRVHDVREAADSIKIFQAIQTQ
ncbi:dihydropteroate synthase [Balneola sp. MJW-20]|uniref:dihydropteroate synthase n=1 Tax=Gracilimonas aurantiaca TaxID=3234185 RepID=UPI0034663FD6